MFECSRKTDKVKDRERVGRQKPHWDLEQWSVAFTDSLSEELLMSRSIEELILRAIRSIIRTEILFIAKKWRKGRLFGSFDEISPKFLKHLCFGEIDSFKWKYSRAAARVTIAIDQCHFDAEQTRSLRAVCPSAIDRCRQFSFSLSLPLYLAKSH